MPTHRLTALVSCLLFIMLDLTVPWVGAMPATQQDQPAKTPDVGSAQPVFAGRMNEFLSSTAELKGVQESAPAGMPQDFEGAWPAVGWQLSDESGADGGEFLWGKRDCHPHTGSYAGWSVGGGAQGSLLSCSANYPDNANTWAIYGPFDLRSATSAVLTFHVYGRTAGAEGCPWDYLFVGSSVNGAEFAGGRYCGDWTSGADGAGYHRGTLNLAGRLGEAQVWIGFRFYSNGSVTDLGFTIDDVALDVNGGSMVTPTRTATPTASPSVSPVFSPSPTRTPTPTGSPVALKRIKLPLIIMQPTPTPTRTSTPTKTPTKTPTLIPTSVLPPDKAESHWPDLAPATQEGVIITWYDNRYGAPYYDDVFAQRFSALGTRLWTGDVWVSADDNSGNERYPSIVTNGVGESRVVWVDGTYEGQVFAQSLQHDGSRSWSTDLAIHDWPNNGKTPRIGVDEANGWYVTWKVRWDSCNNSSSCSEIRVSKMGTGGWTRRITGLVFAHVYWPDISVAANGDSFVVWQRGSTAGDSNIFAFSLDSKGASRWLSPVQVNGDSGTAAQGNARVTVTPSGDVFVIWADQRSGNWDIYAQRLDPNTGQRLWPADKRIDSGIPDTNQLYPEITSAAQFIYAVWADEQANDIYGQKLDRDGAKLWGDSVRINATSQWATLDYAARGPALVADIEGNLYIAWQGPRNNQYDIFLQSYTPSGTRRWVSDVVVEG